MNTTDKDLAKCLRGIDRKAYGAYKSIRGDYAFPEFSLGIDHIQADPFAPPSRCRVSIPFAAGGWSAEMLATEARRRAFEDRIGRAFAAAAVRICNRGGHGPKGSRVSIAVNGQAVLGRNAVVADPRRIEIRCAVDLPARGRTIRGGEAERLLCAELPDIVARGLFAGPIPVDSMTEHIHSVEDQDFLRRWLVENGFVAFVGDGSVLARASGIDDGPKTGEKFRICLLHRRFLNSILKQNTVFDVMVTC